MSAALPRVPHARRAAGAEACPVTALGLTDGESFRVLSADGEACVITPAGLLDMPSLTRLFGNDTGWMRRNFPRELVVVTERAGGGRRVPVGIDVRAVALHLAHACVDAEEARLAIAPRRKPSRWLRLLGWLLGRFCAVEGLAR